MFTGKQIADTLSEMGVSHVVSVPDTTIGPWLGEIDATNVNVIQVCREGEAWGIAAGLYLGGAKPLVLIQCTGLFESGDALRNTVYDFRLPLFAIVGYRSYLSQESLPGDTCLKFTEPILDAWKLPLRFIKTPEQLSEIAQHYLECQNAGTAGVALIAEGKA
jgi:sulfopyruvate decarboxylase TPP-binding subunit